MQLKLVDPTTHQVYPMRDDVYLRGSVVTWYAQNHWRRIPPPQNLGTNPPSWSEESLPESGSAHEEAVFRIGSPVVQQITMEPYLGPRRSLFIWPLLEESVGDDLLYSPPTGRLARRPSWSGEPRGGNFKCEVTTSGLVDGHQAPLIPASREVRLSPYLQMPGDRAPLPRLTALAARWLRESGLPSDETLPGRPLGSSSNFPVPAGSSTRLQGPERDTSIDAIEDFVSNNPRGHCEYFATALAMMLRSQGIPSRVVLGYRCDEWHEEQQCYQVRQLHAHAWVEAFLDPEPDSGFAAARAAGSLDARRLAAAGSDAGGRELGTQAAERTMWGAWQGRWHGLQRYWDKYIVDMDRKQAARVGL